ncbi:MAG: glycosyltransferase family 4 protein [Candidatus Omnitrophica bacterium]|nr:glycosyltransferase family 4 protein [Candidatus Omnitrophota bacterium]
MRVGIDARVLTDEKCGTANYLCRLVEQSVLLDPALRIVLLAPQKIHSEYDRFLQHAQIERVELSLSKDERKGWPARYVPALIQAHKIHVFHQPFNADGPLFFAGVPVVVTILDLIPWVIPGLFTSWRKELRYKFRTIVWTRLARKILTISATSKNDIVRLCRMSPSKVQVTWLGADGIYDGEILPDEARVIRDRHQLAGKRYAVSIGGLNQKRRNPGVVLDGFAQFLKATGEDAYLVFTGSILKFDGFYDGLLEKMDALGIRGRVLTTGYLSDQELRVVVGGAQAMVVSSLYEGFCLPAVEGFACGVPVIANDCGSVSEITGDAAILFGTQDPHGLAAGLKIFFQDPGQREEYKRRGFERVKAFSWKAMAEETLEAYRGCLGKGA